MTGGEFRNVTRIKTNFDISSRGKWGTFMHRKQVGNTFIKLINFQINEINHNQAFSVYFKKLLKI